MGLVWGQTENGIKGCQRYPNCVVVHLLRTQNLTTAFESVGCAISSL